MKLHAQLESTLKVRINSNSEIILGLKKLSEAGKLDKPKELAMFAIILDRLGKMEDEASIEESLKNDDIVSLANEAVIEPEADSIAPQEPATPAVEPTTSPDVPQEPETTPPIETPTEETTTAPAENTTGTVSEFSLDAIAGDTEVKSDTPTT